MANFAKAANEIFQVLKTYSYEVTLYNDDGMKTIEVDEARRFYSKRKNMMISLIDDDDDSHINFSYGPSTHANDISGLIQALREVAVKYALTFRAQRYEKSIEPKTFLDTITEGMYGTTRSSYLKLENARMIVRHSKRIDDSLIGARGRCVEQIFIENAAGERLLFPSKKLRPARAMTQHVNNGGTFSDDVGDYITKMADYYANLGIAARYINKNSENLKEGATKIRDACKSTMQECRKTLDKLSLNGSYHKESQKIIEQAKMLAECGEKEIDETRINEIKQLLNDAELSRSVYESCCVAMNKIKKENPMTEQRRIMEAPTVQRATVGIKGLYHRVDKEAWEKLKRGEIDLTGNMDLSYAFNSSNPLDKMAAKLAIIAPKIKDDTLSNLVGYISDALGDGAMKPIGRDEFDMPVTDKTWKDRLDLMKIIAKAIIKAVSVQVPKLAENSAPIREHLEWLNSFDPNRVLMEDFMNGHSMDPYSTLNGRDMGDAYEGAMDQAIDEFDPSDFAESPEVEDMINGRDPENPEENMLTHDEVMGALEAYLGRYIETYSGDFDDGFNGDMKDTAKEVYDEASSILQEKGFIIDDNKNSEDISEDGKWLSKSDLLLPTGNQGDSLIGAVDKTMVTDPDTKKKRKPDSDYVSHLQSLGWQNTGPNGQAY